MRHHDKQKVLGRERAQRTALLRSLLRAIVLEGSIETTEAKAKALRPVIEKIVTRSRTDSVANRRIVASMVYNDQEVVKKLFTEIAPKYVEREGGYTRIVKLGYSGPDARKLARISFV